MVAHYFLTGSRLFENNLLDIVVYLFSDNFAISVSLIKAISSCHDELIWTYKQNRKRKHGSYKVTHDFTKVL